MKVFILIAFNFSIIFAFYLFFERRNGDLIFQNQQQEKAILKNQGVWFRAQDYVARRDLLRVHLDELGQSLDSNRKWVSGLIQWINKTSKSISFYELSLNGDSINVAGLAKSEKTLREFLKTHDLKLISEKGKNFKASGAL